MGNSADNCEDAVHCENARGAIHANISSRNTRSTRFVPTDIRGAQNLKHGVQDGIKGQRSPLVDEQVHKKKRASVLAFEAVMATLARRTSRSRDDRNLYSIYETCSYN
jgi:hypothetical protein